MEWKYTLAQEQLNFLIIAFTRPDNLKKLLLKISKYRNHDVVTVWINQGYDEKSSKLRQECISLLSCFQNIKINLLEPDEHLPVFQSIPLALTSFFKTNEKGVILEDDCIPSLNFLNSAEKFLGLENKKYILAGSNPVSGHPYISKYRPNFFFKPSKFFMVWGWVSYGYIWLEYWESNHERIASLTLWSAFKILRDKGFSLFFSLDFSLKLIMASKKIIKTWDYQFSFYLIENNIQTLTPNINLVENIGFNTSALNTKYAPRHYESSFEEKTDINIIFSEDYKMFNELYQKTSMIRLLKTVTRYMLNCKFFWTK